MAYNTAILGFDENVFLGWGKQEAQVSPTTWSLLSIILTAYPSLCLIVSSLAHPSWSFSFHPTNATITRAHLHARFRNFKRNSRASVGLFFFFSLTLNKYEICSLYLKICSECLGQKALTWNPLDSDFHLSISYVHLWPFSSDACLLLVMWLLNASQPSLLTSHSPLRKSHTLGIAASPDSNRLLWATPWIWVLVTKKPVSCTRRNTLYHRAISLTPIY